MLPARFTRSDVKRGRLAGEGMLPRFSVGARGGRILALAAVDREWLLVPGSQAKKLSQVRGSGRGKGAARGYRQEGESWPDVARHGRKNLPAGVFRRVGFVHSLFTWRCSLCAVPDSALWPLRYPGLTTKEDSGQRGAGCARG